MKTRLVPIPGTPAKSELLRRVLIGTPNVDGLLYADRADLTIVLGLDSDSGPDETAALLRRVADWVDSEAGHNAWLGGWECPDCYSELAL